MIDWLLRLLKGALIGSGFILPGVSGGALAAVFGLYERIIGFIANITKDFFKNVLFFIPVGIGALLGIFALSHPLAFFLENYETKVLWGFIGCIIGTLPALWSEAGKRGRGARHYIILLLAFAFGFIFLYWADNFFETSVPLNFGTWVIAGVLIALGVLVPGMSPSNFLVYMGMYKPMVDAFKTFDFTVLLPIFLGGAVCLFSLSKVFDILFQKAYAGLFHIIFGVVLASTVMIIPPGTYSKEDAFICVAALLAGCALGYWMSRLESKYT